MRPAVVLVILVLVGTVGCGGPPAAFKPKLETYLREPEEDKDRKSDVKIKPKFVPVDVKRKRVDSALYAALPEEWRAADPDEVKTVIQVTWVDKGPSTFRGRRVTAYRCEFTLVDLETNKILWSASVQGSVRGTNFSDLAGLASRQIVDFAERHKP